MVMQLDVGSYVEWNVEKKHLLSKISSNTIKYAVWNVGRNIGIVFSCLNTLLAAYSELTQISVMERFVKTGK